MSPHLQIYDRRERLLVGVVDLALRVTLAPTRIIRRLPTGPPRRILLLRLERIGDLLMTLGAIAAVRRHAPDAELHLAVGHWNEALARLIPGITRVHAIDAPWLAREPVAGAARTMARTLLSLRRLRFDAGVNFEPDVRSNLILALSGSARRVGHASGGGGALLTHVAPHDPRQHTETNALGVVERLLDHPPEVSAADRVLHVPLEARARAQALLPATGPLIGVHASGGRDIKQWDPARFASVAAELAARQQAAILVTGARGDEAIVARVKAAMPPAVRVIDLVGRLDLVELAAVLKRLALLITGDTGPMHLAAAVGTPVVAVFGPSDPLRYAPKATRVRIVRVDLPCSPCNRIRLPPARCVGHMPDCLEGVAAEAVYAAAIDLLSGPAVPPGP